MLLTVLNKSQKTYFIASGAVILLVASIGAGFAFDRARTGEKADLKIIATGGTNHPVLIEQRKTVPRVYTGMTNFHGIAETVSCSTCHATTTPNTQLTNSADLKEFHQNLKFSHGGLSCLSCHNASDYDSLKLADGKAVNFQNAMQLCAQCHGPQYRDYRHGSHGGMTGYWDLKKGPRERNSCLDCHDAHSPQFQPMMPVFPPGGPKKAH